MPEHLQVLRAVHIHACLLQGQDEGVASQFKLCRKDGLIALERILALHGPQIPHCKRSRVREKLVKEGRLVI